MAMLGQDYQPKVLNAGSALIGIAQIRLGKPSIRTSNSSSSSLTTATDFGNGSTTYTALSPVGQSTYPADATNVSHNVVKPVYPYVANTTVAGIKASGVYSGTVDGNFIVRFSSASAGVLITPDGTTTAITVSTNSFSVASQGVTVVNSASITPVAGDTWVLPAYAAPGSLAGTLQTNIISPYSMFAGATNSVGGLKSASFDVKWDKIATLESGLPSSVDDEFIMKSIASIKFSAMEFSNANIDWLRVMATRASTTGVVSSIPAEVILRTRGGSMYSYWCPSCKLASAPSLSPTNEFSDVTYELTVCDQSSSQLSGTHATGIRNQQLYWEHTYTH